ncbi:hypothetical protein GCM10010151_55750 [Actinoallomurus spadix]|uniref:Uncharacterized protein n=1 Tax=Actinoallomurus spadix TaxID=79912 RepID=A0ABP3H1S1_9ACTN
MTGIYSGESDLHLGAPTNYADPLLAAVVSQFDPPARLSAVFRDNASYLGEVLGSLTYFEDRVLNIGPTSESRILEELHRGNAAIPLNDDIKSILGYH